MAGPEAGYDPERRWIAGVAAGVTYLVLGPTAAVSSALIAHTPVVLVDGVAGLALLDALSGALSSALRDANHRDAALCTFVVTASGVSASGLDAPVLGLIAGLAALVLATVTRSRRVPDRISP
jgi:benzoate membrane transport protein